MTLEENRQIIESTITLIKYKEAFSLREQICTCPNIGVGLQVIYKSPFSLDYFM